MCGNITNLLSQLFCKISVKSPKLFLHYFHEKKFSSEEESFSTVQLQCAHYGVYEIFVSRFHFRENNFFSKELYYKIDFTK